MDIKELNSQINEVVSDNEYSFLSNTQRSNPYHVQELYSDVSDNINRVKESLAKIEDEDMLDRVSLDHVANSLEEIINAAQLIIDKCKFFREDM